MNASGSRLPSGLGRGVIAIGGISLANAPAVIDAGADLHDAIEQGARDFHTPY